MIHPLVTPPQRTRTPIGGVPRSASPWTGHGPFIGFDSGGHLYEACPVMPRDRYFAP